MGPQDFRGLGLFAGTMSTQTSLENRESDPPGFPFSGGSSSSRFPIPDSRFPIPDSRLAGNRELKLTRNSETGRFPIPSRPGPGIGVPQWGGTPAVSWSASSDQGWCGGRLPHDNANRGALLFQSRTPTRSPSREFRDLGYRHADSLQELRLLLLACVPARTTSSLLLLTQLLEGT